MSSPAAETVQIGPLTKKFVPTAADISHDFDGSQEGMAK